MYISAWIFTEEWKSRDESHNKEQRYDEEMIREVKRNEVEEEIRRQVDNLMREELDLLKIVSLLSSIFCPILHDTRIW